MRVDPERGFYLDDGMSPYGVAASLDPFQRRSPLVHLTFEGIRFHGKDLRAALEQFETVAGDLETV